MRFTRPPRRLERVFVRTPVYFITFCTYRKRPYLATAAVHDAFVRFAERAYTDHNVAVGRYVIMPDHLHLFVCGDANFKLSPWIAMLKQFIGKAVERSPRADPIWQRGFFDHVLRSDDSYSAKWNYVCHNPARAGLVANADDWPHAGEIIYIDRA